MKLPKGISVLPSGKFRLNIMVSGVRINKTFPSLEEASSAAEKARAGEVIIPQKETAPSGGGKNDKVESTAWTLQEAVEKTFQVVWAGLPSERTNMFNTQAAMKFFGEKLPLNKITLDRIDDYVAHCQSIGNSNGTINKKLSCLSCVLRTALERGKLKSMPKIQLKKEPQNRIRFLSEKEEAALFKTMALFGYTDQREAVECLLYTGFRCSELWRLEKRDVDFTHGTITLWRTKGGRPRTVPIVEKIRHILAERCKRCEQETGRLFPDSNNDWLRYAWEKTRHYMGLGDDPQFVPHMLRHTCATRLVQRGVSMPVIKEWLGHSNIATTSRYAHFAPSDMMNAAKALCG